MAQGNGLAALLSAVAQAPSIRGNAALYGQRLHDRGVHDRLSAALTGEKTIGQQLTNEKLSRALQYLTPEVIGNYLAQVAGLNQTQAQAAAPAAIAFGGNAANLGSFATGAQGDALRNNAVGTLPGNPQLAAQLAAIASHHALPDLTQQSGNTVFNPTLPPQAQTLATTPYGASAFSISQERADLAKQKLAAALNPKAAKRPTMSASDVKTFFPQITTDQLGAPHNVGVDWGQYQLYTWWAKSHGLDPGARSTVLAWRSGGSNLGPPTGLLAPIAVTPGAAPAGPPFRSAVPPVSLSHATAPAYGSVADVKRAYAAGKLSYDEAARILATKFKVPLQ